MGGSFTAKRKAKCRIRIGATALTFFLLILAIMPRFAVAGTYTVTAEDWARPRSGQRVAHMAGLRGLAQEIAARPHTRIAIRYAGGDEGLLWAEELRGWLVALGISGRRIHLRPGLNTDDRIVVETEAEGEQGE